MLDRRQTGTVPVSPTDHLQQEANDILVSVLMHMLCQEQHQSVILEIADRTLGNWAGDRKWKQMVKNILMRTLPGILEQGRKGIPISDLPALCGKYLKLKWMHANESNRKKNELERKQAVARTGDQLDRFLQNIDLGELDELLLNSQADLVARADGVSEILGKHFGKLGTLAPIGVTLTNTLIQSLEKLLKPAVQLPPDMVAGILANFIQQIDSKTLVRVLNKKNELIRMIHIGSLLEGDGTVSNIEAVLREKMRNSLGELDPEIWAKMQMGVIANKSAANSAMLDAMAENPELVRKWISLMPYALNAKLHLIQQKLEIQENLDKDKSAADITDALDQLDVGCLAETINQLMELFHAIHDRQKDIITRTLSQIAASIDGDLMQSCFQIIVMDVVESFQPVLSGMAPVILKGLYDLFKKPGEEDSAEGVLHLVNRLFNGNGGGGQ